MEELGGGGDDPIFGSRLPATGRVSSSGQLVSQSGVRVKPRIRRVRGRSGADERTEVPAVLSPSPSPPLLLHRLGQCFPVLGRLFTGRKTPMRNRRRPVSGGGGRGRNCCGRTRANFRDRISFRKAAGRRTLKRRARVEVGSEWWRRGGRGRNTPSPSPGSPTIPQPERRPRQAQRPAQSRGESAPAGWALSGG